MSKANSKNNNNNPQPDDSETVTFTDHERQGLITRKEDKLFLYSKHGVIVFDEHSDFFGGLEARSASPYFMRGQPEPDPVNEAPTKDKSKKVQAGMQRIRFDEKNPSDEQNQFRGILKKMAKYGVISGKIPLDVVESIFGEVRSAEACYVMNLKLMDDYEARLSRALQAEKNDGVTDLATLEERAKEEKKV